MRRLLCISAVLGLIGARVAYADDAHAEMAAALAAQADLHPTPISLPKTSAAPRQAAAPSAVKRGSPAHAAAMPDNARAAAAQTQSQAQAQGTSQALVHQAQAATTAAAGQTQAQAAKDRASHSHPEK